MTDFGADLRVVPSSDHHLTTLSMESVKSAVVRWNNAIRRVLQPRHAKQFDSATIDKRYEVCKVLADNGISNVIWLEDLLALHGSNTQVWDLHILVGDLAIASKALLGRGYTQSPPEAKFETELEFSERAIRHVHHQSSTAVVLHSTENWYYQLVDDIPDFLPPINSFLDSMIEFWLNISSRDYVDRLGFALYIGCLINYCYGLQTFDGEQIRDPAYAKNLKPEHREVHYNITAADIEEESFTTTNRHAYHVRRSREIKEGIFEAKPYEKGVFRAPLTTVSEQ